MYWAATVGYQFSPNFAAVLYYEMFPYHRVGAPWSTWANDPADIAPGVSWDITKTVNLTPQLLLYPSSLSLKTMGTIIYLSAKLI